MTVPGRLQKDGGEVAIVSNSPADWKKKKRGCRGKG
jgi:hypothetical protein